MISVLPASAPLRQNSASGKQVEDSSMSTKISEYRERLSIHEISKLYARKALKRFDNIIEDLTGSPTTDKQDALLVNERGVVAAQPAVMAVSAVMVDLLLGVNEDDD